MTSYLLKSEFFSSLFQNPSSFVLAGTIVASLILISIVATIILLLFSSIKEWAIVPVAALWILSPVASALFYTDDLLKETYAHKNGIFMTSHGWVIKKIVPNKATPKYELTLQANGEIINQVSEQTVQYKILNQVKCNHSFHQCNQILSTHKRQIVNDLESL